MHFLCKRFGLYGFMLAAYTERCTSSLSYLLGWLIFFSALSEAAASLISSCPSQDVHTNTATKQKLSLNSQSAIKRGLCTHSKAPAKECAAGLLNRPERQKLTRSKCSGDGEFLCRCCVRCCKEAIRGNELAFLKIPERSELIISKPFFIPSTSTPL